MGIWGQNVRVTVSIVAPASVQVAAGNRQTHRCPITWHLSTLTLLAGRRL